jgi:hypothetical protein
MSLDRDNLEAWLTEHPEAKEDLADLPNLRSLYQSLQPTEPDEAAWKTVLSSVHESIARGPSLRKSSPRLRWAIVGLTAAAALGGVLLVRSLWTTGVPVSVPLPEEPFPVVESEDVRIITMDARDVSALVVGEPPIQGDLEFARPEDIHVIRCERCPFSGRWARLEQEGEVPMFVTAAVVSPHDDN